jgi:hypothetical protein
LCPPNQRRIPAPRRSRQPGRQRRYAHARTLDPTALYIAELRAIDRWSNASAINASANVASTTSDPNPAPNNAASVAVQVLNAPPVITANGALDMTVECATPFTDPGATA